MKSSNVKSISLKIKRFGDCLEVSYFCSLLTSSTCCLSKTKKKLNVKKNNNEKENDLRSSHAPLRAYRHG